MTVKVWTLLITALLLVTGCSKSEVVTTYEQEVAKQEYVKQQPAQQEVNNSPVPVVFDVASGNQATTRALTTEDILKQDGNGFGVFAYYTHGNYPASNSDSDNDDTDVYPNFMYNQRVYWNTALDPDAWDYAPTKYWPNDINNGPVDNQDPAATGSSTDKLSFFAYGPYTSSVTLGTTTYTLEPSSGRFKNGSAYYDAQDGADGILKFESNATARDPRVYYRLGSAAAQDLVYAAPLTNKKKLTDDIPPANYIPSFSFNHALAALKFYVGGNFDVVSGGTGTINTDTYITIESVEITSDDMPYKGWLNLNTGKWEGQTCTTPSNEASIYVDTEFINDQLQYNEDATASWNSGTGVYDKTDWHYGVGRSATDGTPYSAPSAGVYPHLLMKQIGGLDQYVMVMPKYDEEGEPDAITLKVTCNYHVWTLDKRNYDCISKVENNVTNDISFAIENGKVYAITIWLGMTTVKLDARYDKTRDGTRSYPEMWPALPGTSGSNVITFDIGNTDN